MQMLGFSINMLTLFALVLAIGIVVDNAIVVVEAVHVKMHEDGLSPYQASVKAMKEIGGAIVAITLVMSAVFVPVGFMEGTVGIFYRQFSLTLAVAIVISGVNALTLSPALCALLLKPVGNKGRKKQPGYVVSLSVLTEDMESLSAVIIWGYINTWVEKYLLMLPCLYSYWLLMESV